MVELFDNRLCELVRGFKRPCDVTLQNRRSDGAAKEKMVVRARRDKSASTNLSDAL